MINIGSREEVYKDIKTKGVQCLRSNVLKKQVVEILRGPNGRHKTQHTRSELYSDCGSRGEIEDVALHSGRLRISWSQTHQNRLHYRLV